MKRIKSLLIILNLLLLQSCLPSVELNERAIVEAFGIDKADGKFVISVEYYDPNSNNPENAQTSFIKGSGESISLAISKINTKISKKLYFGHNNIVVVGKEAATQNITDVLEYFDIDSQTKSDICVFITENAEEIVGFDEEKAKISPLSILEIIENSIKSGNGCEYRLFKAIGNNSEASCFILPFGTITDKLYFEVAGACLFKNGALIETLDQEKTRGICWYFGNIEDLVLDLNGFEVIVSDSETTVTPITVKNKAFFKINVSINLDSPLKDSPDFDQEKIKKTVAKSVEKEVKKTISSVYTKSGCDIFNFSKLLINKHPDFSKSSSLSDVAFEVSCSCYFS